jgi:nucleoside-diphosphate-sugar epimerase
MSRYGLSKYLAERVVQKYCSRWLILRLNGVVGPHMKKGPVYDILKSDRLWLNAESQFQFLHTSYISRFIRHAIGRNEIYNLTGPDSVSLLECMNLLGRQVPSNNDPPIRHRIDVSKAGKLMPLPPSSVSLDQTRRDYEA